MKQQLKLHKIKSNPKNPRIIKNDRFKKLVHSIINSPGFMELRPVIIDVDSMVIGGNMRLKAHHHLNRKEVWTDMFTKEMIDEILDLWKDLKTGRAKDVEAKKKMITLYNVIHNTNYGTGTSCGSCLSTCYDGIKKLYNKYND